MRSSGKIAKLNLKPLLVPVLALLAGALAPAKGAPTPQWLPVAFGGEAGNRQLFFVEQGSVTRKGDVILFRDMMVRQVATPRGVTHNIEAVRLDCRSRGAVSSNLIFYAGPKIAFTHPGDGKTEHYEPGSAFRVVIDSLCDSDMPDKSVADPLGYAKAYFQRQG